VRTRLLLTAVTALSVVGIGGPAHAQCYPEKPETCHTCRVTGVSIDENGRIWLDSECP
jgi:hypothetical protein